MRIKKGVIIVGSLVLLTLLGIYMGFALHYQNTMLPHTTFAGVSIGGMDVQTAKKTIKKTALDREYKLDDKGKVVAQFTGHVVGSAQDVGTDLAQLKSAQNPWSWPAAMVGGQADAAATDSSTSLKLNQKKINSFVTTTVNKLNANRSQTTNASIAKKDGQFVVTKEVYGNNLDTGKVEKLVKKMVATGQTTGNLQNTYVQPTVKANSEKLQKDLSTLKQLSTVKGHYSISGDTVTIPESLIRSSIYYKDGEVSVNPSVFQNFLAELATKYNTIDKTRTFKTHSGSTVSIPAGTWGWSIQQSSEATELAATIKKGSDFTRHPLVSGSGQNYSGNEIPKTYIDYTGVGLHDSPWQPKYGGDWYKEHGSHGCVNTPPDVMAKLYNLIPAGTPVFIY